MPFIKYLMGLKYIFLEVCLMFKTNHILLSKKILVEKSRHSNLKLFNGNGTKVKTFSEIKPPLGEYVSQIFFCFLSFLQFALLQSFTTDLLSSRELKSIPTPKFH